MLARARRWFAWRDLTAGSAIERRRRQVVRTTIVRSVLGATLFVGLLALRGLG